MTGTLKVTPDRLISASQDFARHDGLVNGVSQQMMGIVKSLNGCWEGDAQRTFVTKFNSLQDDMDKIHALIHEHSTDLEQMGRNYQTSEAKNTQNISGLPGSYL